MTTSELSLEQMKRLAEIVVGGQFDILKMFDSDERVIMRLGPIMTKDSGQQWKPSLTGEDWQQAQALRVIVAAFKLADEFNMKKLHGAFIYEAITGIAAVDRCCRSGIGNDLLHASALALLGDKA